MKQNIVFCLSQTVLCGDLFWKPLKKFPPLFISYGRSFLTGNTKSIVYVCVIRKIPNSINIPKVHACVIRQCKKIVLIVQKNIQLMSKRHFDLHLEKNHIIRLSETEWITQLRQNKQSPLCHMAPSCAMKTQVYRPLLYLFRADISCMF